jgi:hypothetical protein
MKKMLVVAGLFVGITVASSSYALFVVRGGDLTPVRSELTSGTAAVSPIVEKATVTGNTASGNCGSSASGCGSSGGGGCGSSGGGGCGSSAAGPNAEQIQAYLQDYYLKSLGVGITVIVNDLGCHQEAEIKQNNQVIKRLSISGGRITDIT